MLKATLFFALVCVVAVYGNPAANSEWIWETRLPTLSTNPRSIPFHKFAKTAAKKPRVPGTKLVPGCGPLPMSYPKIIGGTEAVPHSFPWQVALFFESGWFCGGSIISEEYILTAAHCTDGGGSVEVVAGAHDITVAEPSQVSITSFQTLTHEDFNSFFLINDIALIKLPTLLQFNDYIAPACLPAYSDAFLPTGTQVVASGWGKDSEDAPGITDTLNQVTLRVYDQGSCEDVYGSSITDGVICTDTTGNIGTCSGDSGGPLNYVADEVNYVRGVTSFGSSSGCAIGFPTGFSRVEYFLDWIEANTGIAIDP